MQTFTDTAGRVWSLAISTHTVKRVRTLLSVDLMEFVEGSLMGKLMGDVVLFVDVLYAICKPEADARNLTDEQFGQAMSGDVLLAAEEALAESLFSISHPSRRQAARTAWEKAKQLRERASELAVVRLNDPAIERRFEEILNAPIDLDSPPPTRGSSSTNSPAWSG
jgi:hypothetical protein